MIFGRRKIIQAKELIGGADVVLFQTVEGVYEICVITIGPDGMAQIHEVSRQSKYGRAREWFRFVVQNPNRFSN